MLTAILQDSEAVDFGNYQRILGPGNKSSGGVEVAHIPFPELPAIGRSTGMNGYTATPDPPPALYVRALYNYDADDQTSLSFREGDIIQVLTQLESGWWDGVINDVRGWFPSNYCRVISVSDDLADLAPVGQDDGDISADSGAEEEAEVADEEDEEYDERDNDLDSEGNLRDVDPDFPIEGVPQDHEEAAFWIPQATPDGRLFYFNTLTGESKMELPLEAPALAGETGPNDRTNFFVPDQTRPPPEMMARGLESEEDYDGSASEAEVESSMHSSQESLPIRKGSAVSVGRSTNTSMDSFQTVPPPRSSAKDFARLQGMTGATPVAAGQMGISSTSFPVNPATQMMTSTIPRYFVDDGTAGRVTWNGLIENMRQSVNSYRQAITSRDRAEFVCKAEDMSDHLRMLLAAGSGTTDNHSGNPSIISTNKALYPHFRDMMSRFSKLVLSSHIAAADWPAPDALAKCLQEADGVMHGVYGYVEVARQQRGEEIPRLTPGFVAGSKRGGNWSDNNISGTQRAANSSFMHQDEADPLAPSIGLNSKTLRCIDEARKNLVISVCRLEEQLHLSHKIITPMQQAVLGQAICVAAGGVIDYFRPWIAQVESADLAPLGSAFQNPQLLDFGTQKQRAYDCIAELVADCQAVTAPLADEWSLLRGQSLEDRLNNIRASAQELDGTVSQISYSLQLILDTITVSTSHLPGREHRMSEGGEVYQKVHLRADSSNDSNGRPLLSDVGQSQSYNLDSIPPHERPRRPHRDKTRQFFGQVPPTEIVQGTASATAPDGEELPWYLGLDHPREVSYDNKFDPAQLKSGTLRGLVEQLTRHDRLDTTFNGTFLLTYRSFTTARELFELLVKRFNIQPPKNLTVEERSAWEEKKQKFVRIRVINILKSWFENYWMEGDGEDSAELLDRAFAFAKHAAIAMKANSSSATPLMTAIEQRMKGQDTSAKRLVLTLNTSAPAPILPKNMKKLKFLDIDATEFARQLTIIESRLYGKIKPVECLDKTWQKKSQPDDPDYAPNVKSLILHSNQLTNWVAEMILSQQEVKKRVHVIKHFVAIADVS